jgi:hypothetical protein
MASERDQAIGTIRKAKQARDAAGIAGATPAISCANAARTRCGWG